MFVCTVRASPPYSEFHRNTQNLAVAGVSRRRAPAKPLALIRNNTITTPYKKEVLCASPPFSLPREGCRMVLELQENGCHHLSEPNSHRFYTFLEDSGVKEETLNKPP